jgi:gliding motility-associated-like protein
MRKSLAIILLFMGHFLSAQTPSMTVSSAGNYNKPYWMAANILVDSTLSIFNSGQNGLPLTQAATNQIGYFQANDTTFPIQSGIVMVAAQNASDVITSPTYGNNTTFTDSELAGVLSQLGMSVTNYPLKDMVEIEFSFIAQSDSIAFNYCFGSHEYDGYTCSNFNDVFGFFLEGNYINGTTAPTGQTIVQNIATIPGTSIPIAVNTINQGFSSTGSDAQCLSANPNYVAHSAYYNSSNGTITTLDGYTDKFTATAEVECGGWYTIRLKLANVSDNWLSSAVFLEESSLKGPEITVVDTTNVGNSFNDNYIVEGCNENHIIFSRSANLSVEMKIPIAVDTLLSTAIEGVDFSTLPDTITLSPGETADTLTFWAYDDNLVEGVDTLVIIQDYVYTDCYNYPVRRFPYYIRDKDSLIGELILPATTDSVSCPGDSIELSVLLSSYEGDYHGFWHGDSSIAFTRYVEVNTDTTVFFTLYDECGDTLLFQQDLYVKPYDPMVYEKDTVRVCPGDSAMLVPYYLGGEEPVVFTWLDNLTNNIPRTVLPFTDSSYYIFSLADGCGELLIDSALAINMPQPSAGFQYLNDPYVPLRVLFNEKAQNEVSWTWYIDSVVLTGQTFEYDFARPGEYEVLQVVTSDFGCIDSITITVSVETDFYLYVPDAFTPDGDGLNECFKIKGVGFEGYEFSVFDRWGNEVFHTADVNECWDGTFKGQPLPVGAYSYRLIADLPFDEIEIFTGTLNILR